jgi:hypothetical protein
MFFPLYMHCLICMWFCLCLFFLIFFFFWHFESQPWDCLSVIYAFIKTQLSCVYNLYDFIEDQVVLNHCLLFNAECKCLFSFQSTSWGNICIRTNRVG